MILERILAVGLFLMLFSFLLAAPAYAYLDPGTGSFACQMLLATVVGAMFVLKLYWSKVKAFLHGFFSKDVK